MSSRQSRTSTSTPTPTDLPSSLTPAGRPSPPPTDRSLPQTPTGQPSTPTPTGRPLPQTPTGRSLSRLSSQAATSSERLNPEPHIKTKDIAVFFPCLADLNGEQRGRYEGLKCSTRPGDPWIRVSVIQKYYPSITNFSRPVRLQWKILEDDSFLRHVGFTKTRNIKDTSTEFTIICDTYFKDGVDVLLHEPQHLTCVKRRARRTWQLVCKVGHCAVRVVRCLFTFLVHLGPGCWHSVTPCKRRIPAPKWCSNQSSTVGGQPSRY
ncbi:hypothetical protein QBC34DRAFT_390032 [Podospora aff. communis PSN243]|uniref:Uncharacterized protein n=1 Tax=Podospora aff. communis PSN243 TaxID=3040156 RepID=A0AAV9H6F0_9PEZI|nr:hypothetical protein QBC34DRAFT_390032 [Podospora aff. communis PSN243]